MGRPKGSRNKIESKAKTVPFIVQPESTDQDLCYVCHRVLWGYPALCGFGRLRHIDCVPGSESWVEYYRVERKHTRTPKGDILLAHYEGSIQ